MKVAINTCYGGFSLSDAAYERMAELGVPVKKYTPQKRDPETGRYLDAPANDGEVIFDRELTLKGEDKLNDLYHDFKPNSITGRYWESWIDRNSRHHPLLIRVIEELGNAASGRSAELKVVEIPDDVEYTIEEYDGLEHITEAHRTWA